MVRFAHDDDSHNDGERCPMCEFKSRLADLLEQSAEERDPKAWDDVQGALVDHMAHAMAALHRLYRERFTDEHEEIANGWEAAENLVQLYAGLSNLHRVVMADPSLGGDLE